MPRLNVAVVGCGLIGSRRARVIAGHADSALARVIDVREDAARALARECGAPWAADWTEVVRDPGVDVVVVSTPNDQLAPVGIAALEAGKHVLIEKPMGRNLAEALRLERAAAGSRRRLKVGFNLRYHPAIACARTLVAQGGIGTPFNARVRYGHGGRSGYEREWRGDPQRAGGGELTDQGIHVVDLLGCFLGVPERVVCVTQTAHWAVEPLEDNAFAILRYPGGAAASFHTSWTQWENLFSFELFGRDGHLAIDGLGGSYGVERLIVGKRRPEGGRPDVGETTFPGPDESWQREWEEFASGLLRGAPYQGTPEDGVAAMRVLHSLYEAAASGQAIPIECARRA